MANSLHRDRRVWLGLAISALCLALLARRADWQELGDALRKARLSILLATLVPKALSFVCLAGRSRALFRRFGHWRLASFTRAHLLGFGGNVVLPLRLGELLRWRELGRLTGCEAASVAAVLGVERGLDLVWLLVLAALLPAFVTLDLPLPATVSASLFAAALALAFAAWLGGRPEAVARMAAAIGRRGGGRIGAVGERLARGFASGLGVLASPRRLAAASAWTLGYWLCGMAGVALWIEAFDLQLPWTAAPVVIVLLALGAAVPAAPGYVGTYHVAAVAGLTLFGIDRNQALAVAVAGHFFATVPAALLAVVLFFDRLRTGATPAAPGGLAAAAGAPRGESERTE